VKRRRFRVRSLLLAWSAYWLALIVVGLSPAIAAIWRLSRAGPGHGNVNAGISDTAGMYATVVQNGVTTYSGSVSMLTVILLLALPPLVMWAVFLLAAPRTINAGESAFGNTTAAQLNAGESRFFGSSSSTSKRETREGS
jgi:hypothetical protein